MATKEDCTCEPEFSKIDFGNSKPVSLRYNPRCPWHKGPDRGYGYDNWGRPNSKHSEHVGTWVTGILLGLLLLAAAYSVFRLVTM